MPENPSKDALRTVTTEIADQIANALTKMGIGRTLLSMMGMKASMELIEVQVKLRSAHETVASGRDFDAEQISEDVSHYISTAAQAIGLYVIKETYEKHRARSEEDS